MVVSWSNKEMETIENQLDSYRPIQGTRGGRARRWGLWGFDGWRRLGAAQGTGLMEAREHLVGGAIAAGVVQIGRNFIVLDLPDSRLTR